MRYIIANWVSDCLYILYFLSIPKAVMLPRYISRVFKSILERKYYLVLERYCTKLSRKRKSSMDSGVMWHLFKLVNIDGGKL